MLILVVNALAVNGLAVHGALPLSILYQNVSYGLALLTFSQVLNAGFNYGYIYGLGLGFPGSPLATVGQLLWAGLCKVDVWAAK